MRMTDRLSWITEFKSKAVSMRFFFGLDRAGLDECRNEMDDLPLVVIVHTRD